jgi:transcriptional regulator with XRE-family HTH domain
MTLRQDSSLAVSPVQIREAWRDLGRQLAEWRKAAALTQHQLAALTWHSRSSIANIETGRQKATRRFWELADCALGADGVLVKAFAQADDLTREYAEQTRAAHQAQANEDRPVNVVAVIVVVVAAAPSQPRGRANRLPLRHNGFTEPRD